ncbi:MAG: hypothetical protein NVS2B16_29880 [Chloroflexota bacterium]
MLELFSYYRAMADRKRLWIVQYLARHGETSVTDLSIELRLSQPLVSWHLRLLRKVNIVQTRKHGRLVYCSLNRDALQTYEQRVDQLLGVNMSEVPVEPDSTALPIRGGDRSLTKGV